MGNGGKPWVWPWAVAFVPAAGQKREAFIWLIHQTQIKTQRKDFHRSSDVRVRFGQFTRPRGPGKHVQMIETSCILRCRNHHSAISNVCALRTFQKSKEIVIDSKRRD